MIGRILRSIGRVRRFRTLGTLDPRVKAEMGADPALLPLVTTLGMLRVATPSDASRPLETAARCLALDAEPPADVRAALVAAGRTPGELGRLARADARRALATQPAHPFAPMLEGCLRRAESPPPAVAIGENREG